jgi:hypothetical protein
MELLGNNSLLPSHRTEGLSEYPQTEPLRRLASAGLLHLIRISLFPNILTVVLITFPEHGLKYPRLRQCTQHTRPTGVVSLKCADSRPQTIGEERNVDAYSGWWDQSGGAWTPPNFNPQNSQTTDTSLQYPLQRSMSMIKVSWILWGILRISVHKLRRIFLLEYTDGRFQLPRRQGVVDAYSHPGSS